jgi:hypothetical protein
MRASLLDAFSASVHWKWDQFPGFLGMPRGDCGASTRCSNAMDPSILKNAPEASRFSLQSESPGVSRLEHRFSHTWSTAKGEQIAGDPVIHTRGVRMT